MQFKSFMEALKGKQHKIDKNKNGQIDAHDFKLLRKEESEEVQESEERMARADYKVGPSGRKSHKEIVFKDAESKDDEDKKDVKEQVQKVNVPAYLRKQQGQAPLKMSDLKRKDTISDRENLAKLRGVKEDLDEAMINGREYASQGIMHPDHAARDVHKVTGQSIDFYAHGTGDKVEGKVTKNDGKSVHIKDTKGKTHMFKVQRGLPKQQNEEVELDESVVSGNKGNGYHGQHDSEVADKKYSAMHAKVKSVAGDAGHMKDVKKPNVMVKHYLDSSRGRHLAGNENDSYIKSDFGKFKRTYKPELHEAKDDSEYNYEGDMAITQLKTICRHAEALEAKLQPDTNLPEWVQSKITLAMDYMQTAHDYLMSELDEQAPVAPVPGQKYKDHAVMVNGKQRVVISRKNVGNYPSSEGWREVSPGTKIKESFDSEGNVVNNQISYAEFALMLEYETKDGRYVHKGTYGGNYVDPEGSDDADDKKPKQMPAEKRGRGRPAGAKSGARKITGTSKLFK